MKADLDDIIEIEVDNMLNSISINYLGYDFSSKKAALIALARNVILKEHVKKEFKDEIWAEVAKIFADVPDTTRVYVSLDEEQDKYDEEHYGPFDPIDFDGVCGKLFNGVLKNSERVFTVAAIGPKSMSIFDDEIIDVVKLLQAEIRGLHNRINTLERKINLITSRYLN
jgi:hypothetical protein